MTRLVRRLVLAGMVGGLAASPPTSAQVIAPAGTTAAVLSFIDAAAGRVEVTRHWPAAPADVDVYPFVPYFWWGCPGPGALMMLVTGGAGSAPLPVRVAAAVTGGAAFPARSRAELLRTVGALRTPGTPEAETLKAMVPWIADLATYERLGYAVFLFVHWQGVRCAVTLRAVPEGYGIPYVR